MTTFATVCSGIDGMGMGIERAGAALLWQAENDAYCSRVLDDRWPTIPNHGDVTTSAGGCMSPLGRICALDGETVWPDDIYEHYAARHPERRVDEWEFSDWPDGEVAFIEEEINACERGMCLVSRSCDRLRHVQRRAVLPRRPRPHAHLLRADRCDGRALGHGAGRTEDVPWQLTSRQGRETGVAE